MPYMPPELLEHSQLTGAADTYSFGMIMWECFTGQATPDNPFALRTYHDPEGPLGLLVLVDCLPKLVQHCP